MVYRSFRLICIVRVILVCTTICIFFFLLLRTSLYVTTITIGFVSIYQIYALINYIEKTNKLLTRFLQSIKYSDFTQSFESNLRGSAFEELNDAFTEVIQEFQRIRAEKEEHFRYLQTVVQHVGIGLIAFKQDGEVELINNAAKHLLQIQHLRRIEDLRSTSKELANLISQIKPGGKQLIKLRKNDDLLQLSIYATKFSLRQRRYTLVSLQNIRSELEEKEMEAWQNLIRVLTHEIMNSIAPISSLASTAESLITNGYVNKGLDSENEVIKDVSNAVKTIEKRSKGLLEFVDNYRKLTRIPKPDFEKVPVKELFNRTKNLMADQLEQSKIDIEVQIEPETLELTADSNLIEQVLINLCRNSVDAVVETSNPIIELSATTDDQGNPIITISDNGQGMAAEVLEKIFIPFFTTKKDGSGIGLSLSKQIMSLHKGTISVRSEPGLETIFTLRF